jgi:hypothetical protein
MDESPNDSVTFLDRFGNGNKRGLLRDDSCRWAKI